MTLGTGILLIAIGAILKFAVSAQVEGVDLGIIGVILMILGAVAFLFGAITWTAGRDDVATRDRHHAH